MEKDRKEIVAELKEYYRSEGIIGGKEFNCKHKNECNQKCNDLAQGMQCHVGTKYGESKIKTLVVSLDCGAGGVENIEERTKTVEIGGNNPHMRVTTKSISNLLYGNDSKANKECLQYYAMTNACKCCYNKSSDQLPDFFYEQCIPYKIKEIEIIDPNVIYFQGKRSLYGLSFIDIDNQTTDIFEYLKLVSIGNRKTYAIKCIHPSARGKHAARKNKFYNEILPEINNYLRDRFK